MSDSLRLLTSLCYFPLLFYRCLWLPLSSFELLEAADHFEQISSSVKEEEGMEAGGQEE